MKKFDDTYTAYALGFLAGYCSPKDDVIKTTKELERLARIPTAQDNTVKPGIIHRPTAKQLADRNLPKSVKEGREAMRETLDQIPELQEHKEALKKIEEMQP